MSTVAYFIWGLALVVFIAGAMILRKNSDNGKVSKKGINLFWMLLAVLLVVIVAIVVISNGNFPAMMQP